MFSAAEHFDIPSIRPVRFLFWLRARLLGAPPPPHTWPGGLVAQTKAIGWTELDRRAVDMECWAGIADCAVLAG